MSKFLENLKEKLRSYEDARQISKETYDSYGIRVNLIKELIADYERCELGYKIRKRNGKTALDVVEDNLGNLIKRNPKIKFKSDGAYIYED